MISHSTRLDGMDTFVKLFLIFALVFFIRLCIDCCYSRRRGCLKPDAESSDGPAGPGEIFFIDIQDNVVCLEPLPTYEHLEGLPPTYDEALKLPPRSN